MASATMPAATPFDASAPSATASQPRKRRRRAPAAGAADDCFTCSNLGLTCDRRRPYCSQCLSDGKDCGGYKTTLTWGVGVASRGKLRGLSLPIAGTAKVAATPAAQSPKRSNAVTTEPNSAKRKRSVHDAPDATDASARSPTMSSQPQMQRNGGHERSRSTYAMPNGPIHWQPQGMHSMSQSQDGHNLHQRHPTHQLDLQTINMPMTSAYEDSGIPASASSMSNFTNYSFPSPVMYSASSDNSNYVGMPTSAHKSPMSLSAIVPNFGETSNGWSQAPMNSNHGMTMSNMGMTEQQINMYQNDPPITFQDLSTIKVDEENENGIEDTVYGNGLGITRSSNEPHYEPVFTDDSLSDSGINGMSLAENMMLSPYANIAIGKTPRMQYLINYYSEVISPVIVAFDGPNNPYRTHILRTAMHSETLQHAIAALSASNLRQRRENNVLASTCKTLPARRSSMAHSALTDRSWQSGVAIISAEDQAREELLHKSMSIQSLNKALGDPARRKDDDVLATLLILCLFHICDSGVAKFQTQFAGVKKLLGLRSAEQASSNTNASSTMSKETSWYTRMFTWFDAFTATVNDREGQLQGTHLDVSSLSDEEWALENLAGCDGRLFKIIAKLGRLNVLSRNGSVEPGSGPPPPQVPYPQHYSQFDGNGWTSMLSSSSPSSMFPIPNAFDASSNFGDSPPSDVSETVPSPDDTRTAQFWTEWNAARTALLAWHLSANSPIFAPSTPTSTLPLSLNLDQKADLLNISESFRYSALLYLERLARPSSPSSDPKIQTWVSRALGYIKLVKSDVYLLWPLFITGSECVRIQDRQCIRQRCLDIQKDSGFMNNWSTLELLEKVWSRSPTQSPEGEADIQVAIDPQHQAAGSVSPPSSVHSGQSRKSQGEDGFRWRQVMDLEKNEGEYIVV